MNEGHMNTVLRYVDAAQLVLAIYASPDGPTDSLSCYEIVTKLLEDPDLLRAQAGLRSG